MTVRESESKDFFPKINLERLEFGTKNTENLKKYLLVHNVNKIILITFQVFKNQQESAYLMLISHLTLFVAKTHASPANMISRETTFIP